MELVYQQNRSQCLAAAASMALSIPLEDIVAFCGHDGSEVIFSELEATNPDSGTRGFHPQEIIAFALTAGYAVTEIEPAPNTYYPGVHTDTESPGGRVWMVPGFDDDRFAAAIKASPAGIFIGQTAKGSGHAVAYDGLSGQVFDPKGKIYPLERIMEEGLDYIHHYFRIDRIKPKDDSDRPGPGYPIDWRS